MNDLPDSLNHYPDFAIVGTKGIFENNPIVNIGSMY